LHSAHRIDNQNQQVTHYTAENVPTALAEPCREISIEVRVQSLVYARRGAGLSAPWLAGRQAGEAAEDFSKRESYRPDHWERTRLLPDTRLLLATAWARVPALTGEEPARG